MDTTTINGGTVRDDGAKVHLRDGTGPLTNSKHINPHIPAPVGAYHMHRNTPSGMTCSNSSSIWILSTLLEFSLALLPGHVLQCALIPHAVPHVDERHFNSIRIREGSEISRNLLQYHVSLTVRISEGRREERLDLPRKSFRDGQMPPKSPMQR